jgi:hypothetical protein
MSTKLELAQRAAKIELGANAFFKKHPELAPLDANVDILSSQILSKDLGPLDSIESWEKAFAIAGDRLCERPQPQPAPPPEPEVWPYAFCRPVRTLQDVKSYPHLEFKSLWGDKKGGVQSEKSRIFQSLVNAILDKENAKRGSR